PAMMTEDSGISAYVAFFKELRHLGYVEGDNLVVERYSGEGRTERYADLARDVVLSHPDLIVTVSARMAPPVIAATATTPIVPYSPHPVAFGVPRRLGQPGANITGVVPDVGLDFWGKRLEFLTVVVPKAGKLACLTPHDPSNGTPGVAVRKA